MFTLFQLSIFIILIISTGQLTPHTQQSQNHHHDHDSASSSSSPADEFPDLLFDESFETLDLQRWKHEITMSGGGNWEFEMYVNSRLNSYVRAGLLYLRPTLTTEMPGNAIGDQLLSKGRFDLWGSNSADLCTSNRDYGCLRVGGPDNLINPIRSARIRTSESFSFQFGRVEVRARMPAGDWIWPAIWLLPEENYYGDWPASGEIDIVESRGNRKLNEVGLGPSSVLSTLHWGPASTENGFRLTGDVMNAAPKGIDFSKEFHIFGFNWNSDGIFTWVDDPANRILTVKFDQLFFDRAAKAGMKFDYNPWNLTAKIPNAAPFDRKFYIVMNVAVGGTSGFFPDSAPGKPWRDNSPAASKDFWAAKSAWWPTWNEDGNQESRAMVVDYIKVWGNKQNDETIEKHGRVHSADSPASSSASSILPSFLDASSVAIFSLLASVLSLISILFIAFKLRGMSKKMSSDTISLNADSLESPLIADSRLEIDTQKSN